MQRVLGTTDFEAGALNAAHKAVDASLNRTATNLMTTANAIWYRKGIVVQPQFIDCNRQFFGAVVDGLDFNDPHSIDVMNAWASEKTRGRINSIVDGLINPNTALLLANAIYFKGKWLVPFDAKNTKDRPFHLEKGQQREIPMMRRTDSFMYRQSTGYQAVRLEYQVEYHGWNLAMYVFLPDVDSSPEKLLGVLEGETWQRLTREFEQRPGTVVLPRFKLKYGIELKEPLKALGMRRAFANADLSGISTDSLFVSAVRQRAFVEVNEQGTEAAVVTMIATEGLVTSPPKPFEMIVGRPFLFLIEDQQTGIILFSGVIFEPEQGL
jgi:serpin B